MASWAEFRQARPDAFYLSGRPRLVDDEQLFEFDIEACLFTRTKGFGDYEPDHKIWRAG